MKVTALIVTHNRLSRLQHCLAQVCNMDFHSIVVVNNASCDGSSEWLSAQSDERLKVLHLPENTGGAGGFSAGLNFLTTQDGWTHVCLFDDDAWPAPDWLDALASQPAADGYCSNVRDLHGKPCVMNLPFTRLPRTLWQTLSYLRNPAAWRPQQDQRSHVVSLSFVGACLTRHWLPALLEALEPRLFLYYDDLSAGVMLAGQGASLRWCPELYFYHAVQPENKVSPQKRYFLTRNILWLPAFYPEGLWSPPVTILRLAFQLLAVLRTGPRRKGIAAWYRGMIDGLRGPGK